jgi:hypothetical protein
VADLLRRARKHGLLVNLSLRPNIAPLPSSRDVLETLITRLHLADKDEIMAYDVAWEPWWHLQEKREKFGKEWHKWLLSKYGSVGDACEKWGFQPENLYSFPENEQLRKDGPWLAAVNDYRAFVDDFLGNAYSEARETIRAIDPNHLVSFRQSEGANPLVDPAWYPIELCCVCDAVDFYSPEAYGIMDDPEKGRTMVFAASYGEGLSPGKPMIWAEYGFSVWDGSAFGPKKARLRAENSIEEKPLNYSELLRLEDRLLGWFPGEQQQRLLDKQAAVYANILWHADLSRAAGTVAWWFPGGYRYNENSDYGLVSADNSIRPAERIIMRYARRMKQGRMPSRVKWTPEIRVRREDSVRGYVGIYERIHEEFFSKITDKTIPLVVTRER